MNNTKTRKTDFPADLINISIGYGTKDHTAIGFKLIPVYEYDRLKARDAEFEEVVGAIENYLSKLQDFANDGDIAFKVAFDDAEAHLNSLLTRIKGEK